MLSCSSYVQVMQRVSLSSLYFLCILELSSAHACVGPVPKVDSPHPPKVPVSSVFWENYCFK